MHSQPNSEKPRAVCSMRWFQFVGAQFSTVLRCIPGLLLASMASADDAPSADRAIRLYAAAAQVIGAARFDKRTDWLAIEGESTTTWTATIDREGEHRASIVYAGDTPRAPFTLAVGSNVVNGTLAVQ